MLSEKRDVILKLDAQILSDVDSEEEIVYEIEEADSYCEKVEIAVITIEQVLSQAETKQQSSLSCTREVEPMVSEPSSQEADRRLAPTEAQVPTAPLGSPGTNPNNASDQVQPGSGTE